MNDDITYNKHGGHPQSNVANVRTNKARDLQRVYAYVYRAGKYGATADETAAALHMPSQTCSARFSDLKKMAAIYEDRPRTRLTRNDSPATVCMAYREVSNVYGIAEDEK